MAIKTFEKDGALYYQVDICSRSPQDRSIRVQRRDAGILEETDPEKIRRKLNSIELRLREDAQREVLRREGAGPKWDSIVTRWGDALTDGTGSDQPLRPVTSRGYIQSILDFTESWMDRPASEITPGDVEVVLQKMNADGYSKCRQYNVKTAINCCFKWAIKNRLVRNMFHPPGYGIKISRKESRRPEILNYTQICYLISEAKRRNHPWRNIWKFALHTGARSGEAFEFKARNADREERRLFFEDKYNFATKAIEPLKDHEWRQVPINQELDDLFVELGVPDMSPTDYVLPRINSWKNGEAAKVLRAFCEEIGIPSVCFHTLRACWATQLLRNKEAAVRVQMMGGWSDLETMERYIRLAGIELDGATDSLKFEKKERPSRILQLVR